MPRNFFLLPRKHLLDAQMKSETDVEVGTAAFVPRRPSLCLPGTGPALARHAYPALARHAYPALARHAYPALARDAYPALARDAYPALARHWPVMPAARPAAPLAPAAGKRSG
jgi:hypothetical protein